METHRVGGGRSPHACPCRSPEPRVLIFNWEAAQAWPPGLTGLRFAAVDAFVSSSGLDTCEEVGIVSLDSAQKLGPET